MSVLGFLAKPAVFLGGIAALLAGCSPMHRIAGVVREGVYHSRQDLDALAARVAAGHGFLR